MGQYYINGRRYDTDQMVDLGIATGVHGGVRILGVYMTVTPTIRRVYVETRSSCVFVSLDGGRGLHEATAQEIATLAQNHNCAALAALLPDDSE